MSVLLLTVSIVYGIVLLFVSEYQRSLFSLVTTVALYLLLQSIFKQAKKFDAASAVVAILGSVAKIAWTILVNSIESLRTIDLGISPVTEGGSYIGSLIIDVVLIVISIVLLILRSRTKYLENESEPKQIRCHIIFTLIFMVLSCLLSNYLYHFVMVLAFTTLFSKWAVTKLETNSYLSPKSKTIYSILILVDFILWGSSTYWAPYLSFLSILHPISETTFMWAKFCSLVAFSLLQIVPEGEAERASTTEVKARWKMNFEARLRVIRVFLYHYVNSPVGIFIQNSLIIFWTFMYPSVLTVVLLILSTLNMILVKSNQIEDEILLTPVSWTQTLLIIYVQIIGLFFFIFSSGLATILESYPTIYYLFFGGLTNFGAVNWFVWVFIFYMGWCTIMSRDLTPKKVSYPAYLKRKSPANVYRVMRVIVLIACVLTCLISPDLTLAILLFVFFFSNFSNLWLVQVIYSALVSGLKICIGLIYSTDTENDVFELFGLRGGVTEGSFVPVDVYNFYSLVNGIIMALAGFNYLALRYENQLNAINPPEPKKGRQRLFKDSVWILYLIYYATTLLAVPSYMTAISLFILCLIVAVHILHKESAFLWWTALVVEVVFFIYGYLNMFDLLRDKLTFGAIKPLELGLFVTNSIVESVTHGEVFFYLIHFFIRIVIATSRISYLHGKKKEEKEEKKEEKLSDYYHFSVVLKLFVYNHFPKVLLAFVVLISYVEEDVMSYILFILFLFNAFVTIRRHPRWSAAYKYYTAPASIFVVCRFAAQFSWNIYANNDENQKMHIIFLLVGLKKYVPDNLPEVYPSFTSRVLWDFARGTARAIVYYFTVIVICALSRMIEKMGQRLIDKLHSLESQAADDTRECKVIVEDGFDEVYRLSTILMRGMYLKRKDQASEAIDEYNAEKQKEADEEREIQEALMAEAEGSDEEMSPMDEEMEIGQRSTQGRKKEPFVFRVFKSYVTRHNVPTPHIFYLRLRKNLLLFHAQLVSFINNHSLDILRLVNIGMMTIACGTDNFDSLLNILLIIPMTINLKSYMAAPFVAGILCVLLFLEYALYIFPDKEMLADFLNLSSLQAQARNYLMIANISSVYMIPNTVTMVCCIIQHQINKEINQNERAEVNPEEVEMAPMDKAAEVPEHSGVITPSEASDPSEKKMHSVPTLSLKGMLGGMKPATLKSPPKVRRTTLEIMLEWMTLELHDLMLIVIFLASVFNTNLLSLVYLGFSLWFLFFPSIIKQQNNKAIKFIKWYAFVHLAITVIFQLPFIPEPSACELSLACPNWHRLLGLNKIVYQAYVGNPTCSLEDHTGEAWTACPHPYQFDEGILSIVIINIIVNIEYLVQSSPYYGIVARHDAKKLMQSAVNNNDLINTWKKRLERRQREVAIITSLLYNQLCIILNKVLFVDKQLYASKDKKFSLPPTIHAVEATSPYAASITFEVNEKTWAIEDTISGFIVGIIEERTDDVPNMNHVGLEVYFPNNDLIHDHRVTINVTQLKPCTSYKFTLCCLFPQGRTSVVTTENSIVTPPTTAVDTYLWSRIRIKIDHYVYDSVQEMAHVESFNHREQQLDLDELAMLTSRRPGEEIPESPSKGIHIEPVTAAQMKDLDSVDMLINTQSRKLLIRKKEKDIARYDLCRVINARFFPNTEDSDRDYVRLIIQWDTLKCDYLYIFRSKTHSKGFNVHQLIEWFNLVLPFRVAMDTLSLEEGLDDDKKEAAGKVLKLFKKPTFAFSSKWKSYLTLQKIFTVVLLLYLILRDDLVSLFFVLFYMCYAALFCIHVPYIYFNSVSWILTAVIFVRFLLQTSLVSQYISDGVWKLAGMTNSQSPYTDFTPTSFQWIHILGFYKTSSAYDPPAMSSLIWDLLFLLLINYCKSRLRHFALKQQSADDILLQNARDEIVDEKVKDDRTIVVDDTMPVKDLIHKQTDAAVLRFRHYPPWLQNFLLKMFPDMFSYVDERASTHPFKFGRDYYTPILVTQMILVFYVFLFYSSMTEMNYAFSQSVSSGTIQSGTVIWICIIVIVIVVERIFNVKRMLVAKYCMHIVFTIALHIYCFIIVPGNTQTHFLHNGYLVVFYLICLAYMWFSVLQIRAGYPTKDQYIQKVVKMDYSMTPYMINTIYRAIPFLYELNCLIDWSVTESSCDLWTYMRVEEIRNTMFIGKYKSLTAQKDSLKNQGEARGTTEKLMWGFSMIIVIVLLLLLPLVIFSSDSSALVSNPVKAASLDISLVFNGEPLQIYSYSHSTNHIESVNSTEYYRWQNLFKVDGRTALLPKWTTESQVVTIPSVSNQPWSILEDYADRVVELVREDCSSVSLDLTMSFIRDLPSDATTTTQQITVPFNQTQCDALIEMLDLRNRHQEENQNHTIVFERIYPRLYFLNSATEPVNYDTDESLYNSIEIELKGTESYLFGMQYHWIVRSDSPDSDEFDDGVLFWVINETQLSQLLASSISSLGSASITGLYVIVLITVGTYFRGFLVPAVASIAYVTMPDPLPVLELICGLYITRIDQYKGHLKDEKKICDLIITIIRSNAMLVQLTRVQPLHGVLQLKDESITTSALDSNDISSNTSLLPLISSVIRNMQVV